MIPESCTYCAFDSMVLDRPVWKLTDPLMAVEAVKAAKVGGVGLLFVRGKADLGAMLEPMGFRAVEDLVTFESHVDRMAEALPCAMPEDAERVGALARRAFHCTRWHLDPKIPDETANAYKAQWAKNAVRGRAIAVLVSHGKTRDILGFNALMAQGHTLVIDLIAVAPEWQGHGIGRALVDGAFAFASNHGYARIRVGTQSVNVASRRLYEAMGFQEMSRDRTWHFTP